MFYIKNDYYIPLLAVTYAIKAENEERVKNLFEEYVSLLSSELLRSLFNANDFCKSLTVEKYRMYQYFYGLCVIDQLDCFPELSIKLEKLYREIFGDIYRMVRKNKTFNIMDYYFLYQESDGLTIKDKLEFSNRATALSFFVLNKWGKIDKIAYDFGYSLFSIVLNDKAKREFVKFDECFNSNINSEKQLIQALFNKEAIEIAFEDVYGKYNIDFDMIYAAYGDKLSTFAECRSVKNIIWKQIGNSEQIIDFLTYNMVILLKTLEKNMEYLNDSSLHLSLYLNDSLQKENDKLLCEEESLKKEMEKLRIQKDMVIQTIEQKSCSKSEKIIKLEEEIKKQRQLLKETIALRNFVYHNAGDIEYKLEDSSDDKWEKLNEYEGLIVGGNDVWQKRMQELLPRWKFVSSSLNSVDKNVIANAKYVFINTSVIGHSMYYGIVAVVQASEIIKLGFINSHNPDRVHDEIVSQIND